MSDVQWGFLYFLPTSHHLISIFLLEIIALQHSPIVENLGQYLNLLIHFFKLIYSNFFSYRRIFINLLSLFVLNHSVFRLFIGSAIAALIDLYPTAIHATNRLMMMAAMKINGESFILYSKF